MRIRIILNPNADLGRGARYWQTIRDTVAEFGDAEIVVSAGPGDAQRLAAEAIEGGCEIIVAAGGDGTINEIVNSLMACEDGRPKLGIIPIGTGNDFAHAMGVATDVPEAVRNIFRGRTRKADLALMEDDKGRRRYFENNLGVGFDASVVIRTAEIRHVHGFLKYILGVLTTLALDYRPINLDLRYDAEQLSQEVLFVSFGIGPRHGGGFLLTPVASHEDDLVDSCTVTMLGRLRALSLLRSAMKGTHVDTPYVTMRQNCRVEIESVQALPIHIDGEIYARASDEIRRITITTQPAALEVIV